MFCVCIIEAEFFSDSGHSPLLSPKISDHQRHFYNIPFLELQIQTALCTVLLQ